MGRITEIAKARIEARQLEKVGKDFRYFKYMKHPTEKVQILAVTKNPFILNDIKNPSLNVIMTVGKEYGFNQFIIDRIIGNFSHLTEDEQIILVSTYPEAIRYINNPSSYVKLIAAR